jgi:hypothetical protein
MEITVVKLVIFSAACCGFDLFNVGKPEYDSSCVVVGYSC